MINLVRCVITSTFLAILNSILIFNLAVNPAFAQTASLLPNAQQQFLDADGNPVSSGTVDFYIPGTSTRKTTWQDAGRTTPNTNPVSLDAGGYAKVYGFGSYRQVVKDKHQNLIWDQVTNSYSIPNAGSATGDGLLVGSILPWSGLAAPNQYVFAFGQELSRATFPDLFTAITLSQSVNCTVGSPAVTGASDTSQVPIGATIEAACFSGTATVTAKTTSTYTVNVNAIVTTTVTAVVFPYGDGNGTSTFNVPDLRGRTLAGRDNMGNVAANRLTATSFINSVGTGVTGAAIGAAGGNQGQTVAQANLPNVNFSVNIPSGTSVIGPTLNNATGLIGGSGGFGFNNGSNAGSVNVTANNITLPTLTGTAASGGSATPLSVVQPTLTINYVIKTTADTSFLVATGVMSLGGMTGTIGCVTGLICTGQTLGIDTGVIPSGPSVFLPISAIRGPVDVATTGSNITLSGEQTIGGVLTNSSRVLVKDQTLATENGIYNSSSGAWSRSADFTGNGAGLVVHGTCVRVTQGTLNVGTNWCVTTANPITVGTTPVTFSSSQSIVTSSSGTYLPYGQSISQTASGTLSCPLFGFCNFNSITINDSTAANTNGLFVFLEIPSGGTAWNGAKSAITGIASQNATPTTGTLDQLIGGGFTGQSYTPAYASGNQSVFGVYPQAYLLANATGFVGAIGNETDVFICAACSATDRIGTQVISVVNPQNPSSDYGVQGTSIDAAYLVGAVPNAAKWQNALYLYANSIATGGCVLCVQSGGGVTPTYGINLSNLSFGLSAFQSNGFAVDPNGKVYNSALGIVGTSSGTVAVNVQANAGTYNFNIPTTAGTSGYYLTSAGGGSSAMTWTSPATASVQSLGNYSTDSTLTITGTGSGPWTGLVTIKCTVATSSQIGCSKPDNVTIKAAAGVLSTQNTTLGSTAMTPGSTYTTIAGLTSLTSTNLIGTSSVQGGWGATTPLVFPLSIHGTTNSNLTFSSGALQVLNDANSAYANLTINGASLFLQGNGTTVITLISGAQIGAPIGGDKGAGTLNAAGAYYANGTKGVTCSGALTAITSITITNGIITAATGTGGTCS